MEAIVDLKDMMVVGSHELSPFASYPALQDAFGKFKGLNGCLPKRIVFFRDGVSEGEFSRVRDVEVGAIHGEWAPCPSKRAV